MSPKDKESKAAQRAYEAQMVRVAAHPVRAKALSMMAERPSSPKELAEAVDKPIGNVAYHIRALEKAGLVLLVDEKKRGGAIEHFYRATTLFDEDNERTSPVERRLVARTALHLVIGDAALAIESGAWDARTDSHLSRTPLYLDEQGWGEIGEIFSGALRAVLEAQAQCAKRLDQEGKKGFSGLAAMILFEMPGRPERD